VLNSKFILPFAKREVTAAKEKLLVMTIGARTVHCYKSRPRLIIGAEKLERKKSPRRIHGM
jgi:hypothetical protein